MLISERQSAATLEQRCSRAGAAMTTCVLGDGGDTRSLLLFLSGAPNEVITVFQTGVSRTFDPCPSPRCNVNSTGRRLYKPLPPLSSHWAASEPSCHATSGRAGWTSRWPAVS